MNIHKILLQFSLVYFLSISTAYASGGNIYYNATALRNICYEIFPEHKKITSNGYEQWANEHYQELEKVQSEKNYDKYLLLIENLARAIIVSKDISMNEFEYKCLNMYEILIKESNN